MSMQTFARVFGWLYLAVGLLGFFPGIVRPVPPDAPHLMSTVAYGYLMGLFPINLLHNLVHIGIGGWGVAAAGSVATAKRFAQGLAIFYGALAIMGLIPVLNTTFGLIPIFGHDVWLHALSAAVAAYFGFGSGAAPMTRTEAWRKAS